MPRRACCTTEGIDFRDAKICTLSVRHKTDIVRRPKEMYNLPNAISNELCLPKQAADSSRSA